MRDSKKSVLVVVLALALTGMVQGSDEARLAALRDAGTGASLTVYPFVLGKQPIAQVGAVVGVMMEQAGLEDVGTDETVFRPKEGAGIDEIAAAFGGFVKEKGIDKQYALYGEYLGSHSSGITEIRAFLVDRDGNVVWAEKQAPGDAEFDSASPQNPMECCLFVAERLKQVMALPEIPEGTERKPGNLERRMAQASGVPEESEFEAMKERAELLAGKFAEANIRVYPVKIGKGVDRAEAERLSSLLGDAGFKNVQVAGTELPIEVKPARNEQKMLWSLARSFQDYIRANPPEADYLLYADYLMQTPAGPVGAVHLVVCDKKGDWVIVDFQNSHHEDFQKIAPKNAEGCAELAATRLKGYVH